MNAFIVRPFGEKNGINFDLVEADLIRPALAALKIPGGTTGLLTYAGNFRTDMFEQLLLADLVIADISIHNANVFYELGVRHGLRDKRTFLIRCKGDEVPFDLKTDRYLEYDRAQPAGILDKMIEGIRSTMTSIHVDSPVFQLLPKLRPPARESLLTVPEEFELEVRQARESSDVGRLALLVNEINDVQWEIEGLRALERALFKLKAYPQARTVLEKVRDYDENDIEANLLLGTVYERMGDLAASDFALERALKGDVLTPEQRAEVHALVGRNAKRRWQKAWQNESNPASAALQSGLLVRAEQAYDRGFSEDQNHFFSGLNALALLTVRIELARKLPKVWSLQFDRKGKAKAELDRLCEQRLQLAGAVDRSLKAAAERLARLEKEDIWLDFSKADFKCLTSKTSGPVGAAYRSIGDRAEPFATEAARNQLWIYERLGVLSGNVRSALEALPRTKEVKKESPHVFLFTGHQIDSLDRGKTKPARFPPEKEAVARQRIKQELVRATEGLKKTPKLGIAGAASGGDILFHEVCAELGIPTNVYLALPDNMFINESVAQAGADWVKRFQKLLKGKNRKEEVRQLAEAMELPKWLHAAKPDYGIWQRNNLWMLNNAVAIGGEHTTLIALWDKSAGVGPGGTEDMVRQAEKSGARVIIINSQEAFGLG